MFCKKPKSRNPVATSKPTIDTTPDYRLFVNSCSEVTDHFFHVGGGVVPPATAVWGVKSTFG